MANSWVNYQAIFGLAVGVNLALVTFPRLSQPAIEMETERWARTRKLFPPDNASHTDINAAQVAFIRMTRDLAKQAGHINWLCYVAALINGGMLIYASFCADYAASNGAVVVVLMCGAVPIAAFCLLNRKAKSQLKMFSEQRQGFDRLASA